MITDIDLIAGVMCPVLVLHVVDCLDSQLVRGPVWTDRDGGEVQLPQVDPVNGAGAGVLVPVSEAQC